MVLYSLRPVYFFNLNHRGLTNISLVQKNSVVAGALTGAAVALTTDDHSHEQVVQFAITGAALSTAANLLTGIF